MMTVSIIATWIIKHVNIQPEAVDHVQVIHMYIHHEAWKTMGAFTVEFVVYDFDF